MILCAVTFKTCNAQRFIILYQWIEILSELFSLYLVIRLLGPKGIKQPGHLVPKCMRTTSTVP